MYSRFCRNHWQGLKQNKVHVSILFIHCTHLTQSPLVSNSVYLVNVFRKCILCYFRLDRSWTDDLDTDVVL